MGPTPTVRCPDCGRPVDKCVCEEEWNDDDWDSSEED